MANIKISELNELEEVDNDDLLVIVDTSSNETKKVKARNVGTGGGGSEVVIIDDEQPTSEFNKLWIDTGEVGSQASEITNEYSTSTGLGYSANYINNLHTYSTQEQRIGTWTDGKPLYRKVITANIDASSSTGTYKETYINTGVTNIVIVDVRIKAEINISGNNRAVILPYTFQDNTSRIYLNSIGQTIVVSNNTTYGASTTITILYTKTTD